MLFNSLPFLYVFLPITYLVFWRLRTKDQRYVWLTITGYVFYSFWNYKFCALLAFSTLVSYVAGLGLLSATRPSTRRVWLVVPIVSDLTVLAFFKYVNFLLDTVRSFGGWAGVAVDPPRLDVLLPVGISFYTFHNISYIVDSYRGIIRPTRNLWEYACYVSLFSQLVAGPIVRFREIERDLDRIDVADRMRYLAEGWSFFAVGMIEKVLVADTIAAIINPALARYAELSTADAWLCTLGYTYQLYFDFVGYSDMAVGLGYLFGLRIPQNFNSPYRAVNIADFWRRWHISLTSCLRDYIYIPLGGNRGSRWAVSRNLMITLLLGGLWHGASWTFVAWGAYHGLLLLLYRLASRRWDALPGLARRPATFLLVVVGWVIFRSESFEMAAVLLRKMWVFEPGVSIEAALPLALVLLIAGAWAHAGPNAWQLRHAWKPAQALALAALFVLCLVAIYGAQPTPFLYFQF